MATIDIGATKGSQFIRAGVQEPWATIRAGAGTQLYNASTTGQSVFTYYSKGTSDPDWNQLRRTGVVFDLSALGGNEVTAASLSLDYSGTIGTLDDETDLDVVPFTPTAAASVVAADYALANWDMSTPLNDTPLDTSASTSVGTGYPITLNASGHSYLTSGLGEANYWLGVVQVLDRTNTAPTWGGTDGWTYDGGEASVLSLTYGVPTTDIAKAAGIAEASIAKYAGIAKASVAKVAGIAN